MDITLIGGRVHLVVPIPKSDEVMPGLLCQALMHQDSRVRYRISAAMGMSWTGIPDTEIMEALTTGSPGNGRQVRGAVSGMVAWEWVSPQGPQLLIMQVGGSDAPPWVIVPAGAVQQADPLRMLRDHQLPGERPDGEESPTSAHP